jgi:hypothetical protein
VKVLLPSKHRTCKRRNAILRNLWELKYNNKQTKKKENLSATYSWKCCGCNGFGGRRSEQRVVLCVRAVTSWFSLAIFIAGLVGGRNTNPKFLVCCISEVWERVLGHNDAQR